MKEKMPDFGFRLMQLVMKAADHIHPHIELRAESFGIKEGTTVVDYGCGPGRYTEQFARLVGENGKVFAVDLVELALAETEKRVALAGCRNVEIFLATGYDSGVPSNVADIVFAIDMIHFIRDPQGFLEELFRIAKDDGVLILSGGHQSRATIKKTLATSDLWALADENRNFITYCKSKSMSM